MLRSYRLARFSSIAAPIGLLLKANARKTPFCFDALFIFGPLACPSLVMKSSASALRSPKRLSQSSNSLHLPQLPRFHPANFSTSPSGVSQPSDNALNSPQPPVSPRHEQFQRRSAYSSDVQRQLYLSYQRELINRGPGSSSSLHGKSSKSPSSPRLEPLGSPGPVTPLALEGDEDYIFAGAKSVGYAGGGTDEIVDNFIVEGSRPVSNPSSRPTSRPSSRAGIER